MSWEQIVLIGSVLIIVHVCVHTNTLLVMELQIILLSALTLLFFLIKLYSQVNRTCMGEDMASVLYFCSCDSSKNEVSIKYKIAHQGIF